MKKLYQLLLVFVIFSTGGCTVIEDIFEAGFWAGLIANCCNTGNLSHC